MLYGFSEENVPPSQKLILKVLPCEMFLESTDKIIPTFTDRIHFDAYEI